MRPEERKSARLRVVEALLRPGLSVMTIHTILAEITPVSIVDRVARNAFSWRVLVCLRDMASRTTRHLVCARQGVLRLRMVETAASPNSFVVALAAILTERPLMGVFFPMTCDAIGRCLSSCDLRFMTLFTGHTLMTTSQGIVGLAVIECRLAQAADICVSTEMIRMAASALT